MGRRHLRSTSTGHIPLNSNNTRMVPCEDGETWLHFDLVPEEFQIRSGPADYTGRLCVIGAELKEDQLEKLFLLA